jgi:hypothetical protein
MKVHMAGVHKKLNFFQSTQSGDQSVIRYVDFGESPRELSPKSRTAVLCGFRLGGACRTRSGFNRCGDWSHALPVVGNAIDEKLEACKVSSPHQL